MPPESAMLSQATSSGSGVSSSSRVRRARSSIGCSSRRCGNTVASDHIWSQLASGDGHLEPVLRGRQRAGRKRGERAGQVGGAVEVEADQAIHWRGGYDQKLYDDGGAKLIGSDEVAELGFPTFDLAVATRALDALTREQMQEELRRIWRTTGTTSS
jgi:hypothetical protein